MQYQSKIKLRKIQLKEEEHENLFSNYDTFLNQNQIIIIKSNKRMAI